MLWAVTLEYRAIAWTLALVVNHPSCSILSVMAVRSINKKIGLSGSRKHCLSLQGLTISMSRSLCSKNLPNFHYHINKKWSTFCVLCINNISNFLQSADISELEISKFANKYFDII